VAFTTAQRWQVHRLPVPGGDELGQRYAHSGAIEQLVTSGILTQAQRWQAGYRLPIPDGDIDTIGDRYALAGAIQSIEAGGAVQELFEVDWLIAPTWTALELPQHNVGNITAGINAFSTNWSGTFSGVRVPDVIIRQLQFAISSRDTNIIELSESVHASPSFKSTSIVQSVRSTQIVGITKSIQITAGISGIIIHGNQ